MRQRRVTGIEERLSPYADLILSGDGTPPPLKNPSMTSWHPRWYQRTSPRFLPLRGYECVYVEIGCGCGRFINELAAEDPEALYIGVEGCKTFVIRGLEKTRAFGLKNVRYIDSFINDPVAAFGEETVEGFFLNFSDPWPKERHAERRLTSPAKAEGYYKALKRDGFVSVKTDGEAFFRYSLATFTAAGFTIVGSTEDKNNPAREEANPPGDKVVADRAAATPTEYELKFRAAGLTIHRFTAEKK